MSIAKVSANDYCDKIAAYSDGAVVSPAKRNLFRAEVKV